MKKDAPHNPKQQLRSERLRHGWSQQELAEKLGTSIVTINRWERGVTEPSPYFRLKLCALFGKSAIELGLLPDDASHMNTSAQASSQASEQSSSNTVIKPLLPFHRNALFTGRETTLEHIHALFHDRGTHVVALTGLGGIGKTQIAIEYVYRFRQDYDIIVWLHAEDSTTLTADCTKLLRQLHLLKGDEQQQGQSIEIMQHWLARQRNLLLILDNGEDGRLIQQLLPSFLTGHVLLTTRTQVTGTMAQQVDLKQMTEDESMLLLLRRAKLLSPDTSMSDVAQNIRTTASDISQLLAGLPLALDQAGAYIEETSCSLPDYLERYHQHRKVLLARRGENPMEHPASVVATISYQFAITCNIW